MLRYSNRRGQFAGFGGIDIQDDSKLSSGFPWPIAFKPEEAK
jgi:hypothetical protein